MIECESINKSSKSVIMTGGLKRTTNENALTLNANLNRAIMLFLMKCFIIERIVKSVYQK